MSDQFPAPPQPPWQPVHYLPPAIRQTNPLSTAGMVLGILSCVFIAAGIFELAMVVLAITFGGVALAAKRRHLGGRGKAQAAIILGIVGAVFYAVAGILSAGALLVL